MKKLISQQAEQRVFSIISPSPGKKDSEKAKTGIAVLVLKLYVSCVRYSMRIIFCLTIITILMMTGCTGTPSPTPTSTPLSYPFPQKQPEPHSPLIGGQVLGLSDDTLLTIHVKTPGGRETRYCTQRGNGHWEIVVTDASGVDYVVTAEAFGYETSPISYTIHLSDKTAYVVEAGQITRNEALNLDFQFTASSSPSY